MTRLEQLARDLRNARRDQRTAKAFIDKYQDEYFKLLNEYIGEGQVTFDFEGERYGRVMAEKAKFRVTEFLGDHPEIAEQVLSEKTTWSVDEEALNEYLAAHPEDTALVQSYIETIEEARWKNPVAVKEEQ